MSEPRCPNCKKPYTDHLGVQGLCAEVQRIAAERDQLKIDVVRLKAAVNYAQLPDIGWKTEMTLDELETAYEAIVSERDAALTDAARYKLVRSLAQAHSPQMSGQMSYRFTPLRHVTGNGIDEAVDRAIVLYAQLAEDVKKTRRPNPAESEGEA